jgi:hypothetical protein
LINQGESDPLDDELKLSFDIVGRCVRPWGSVQEGCNAIPHAGLFYGANPDGDARPEQIRAGMLEAHSRKIEPMRRRRDGLPPDSVLRDAYKHKIMEEEAGRALIAAPANMRGIIAATRNSIVQFERRLLEYKGEWIISDGFTLADIFWGVTLYRLLYLGYDRMWNDCPHLSGYAERVFAAPATQRGVVSWPRPAFLHHRQNGNPPSACAMHLDLTSCDGNVVRSGSLSAHLNFKLSRLNWSTRRRDQSQPCFTIGHALSLRGRAASSGGTVASSLR